MKFVKAQALGNDFLLLESSELPPGAERAALARALCDRRHGVGGDGLIVFDRTDDGASMRLLNADGSPSEVSGNGVRCLAAWIAATQDLPAGAITLINTDAGVKRLELLSRSGAAWVFRAAMGRPERIERRTLDVSGQLVPVVTMRVGNPQCVVLGDVSEERLETIASALSVHPQFPEGTNVELATMEERDRVRILIWERGVGPTLASGTGACAAAVAAMRYAGAPRDVQVTSPGGTQRVEWREDGLYLTGPARIVATVAWVGEFSAEIVNG
jgi:diaminopimelate epimerase